MSLSNPYNALFLTHSLIETIAMAMFLSSPQSAVSTPQPHAYGLIRQYGLSLLTLNLCIWAIIYHRSFLSQALAPFPREATQLRQTLALALATYHLGVSVRGLTRIAAGDIDRAMGGPYVHAGVHVPLGILFVAAAIFWSEGEIIAVKPKGRGRKAR